MLYEEYQVTRDTYWPLEGQLMRRVETRVEEEEGEDNDENDDDVEGDKEVLRFGCRTILISDVRVDEERTEEFRKWFCDCWRVPVAHVHVTEGKVCHLQEFDYR